MEATWSATAAAESSIGAPRQLVLARAQLVLLAGELGMRTRAGWWWY